MSFVYLFVGSHTCSHCQKMLPIWDGEVSHNRSIRGKYHLRTILEGKGLKLPPCLDWITNVPTIVKIPIDEYTKYFGLETNKLESLDKLGEKPSSWAKAQGEKKSEDLIDMITNPNSSKWKKG